MLLCERRWLREAWAAAACLGDDVKEERLDVVVERLVVEEEFSEQAETLAIHLNLEVRGSRPR